MRQIPIVSGLLNYLTAPTLPSISASITENNVALISLKRKGGEFEPGNLGVTRLPDGLVKAHFSEPNISDELTLGDYLSKTAEQANIRKISRLSVTLPVGSARTIIVALDSIPDTRAELNQMIEWKVERNLGYKVSDLRISYTRLSDSDGRPQWVISAVQVAVLSQYERVFRDLGWQVGLIAPQHIGEAQWLIRAGIKEDQVAVSLHDNGFDIIIVRGSEPILIREVICPPEEREDEFFRLLVYYRDRIAVTDENLTLNRFLIIGNPAEQRQFREVFSAALERNSILLSPQQLGLNVDSNAPVNSFFAAAGLATMAWS
jgi:Tfp pilus assembly PilM family ATPase